MRKIFFIGWLLVICFVLLGCKVRKVDTEKHETRTEVRYNAHLDSVTTEVLERMQRLENRGLLQAGSFSLSTVKDSAGGVRDLVYTHERNGKVIEKITVTGGRLATAGSYKVIESSVIQRDTVQRRAGVNSDSAKVQTTRSSTVYKERKVRVRGFQWGVYGVGLVVIALFIYLRRKR
ncbi:hypothetical protein SAMN05444369_101330 [Capnocytophaga haemolytica]|uniref:Uncharacterized protein n=1 Tax=Capnocytophaga haemolytica TaxID=45243 RepID=A0AAX2GYD1_9FLAO|nr:hypothetical protein [Capnocytophaga haemolytica]AMD85084.1 hypothetical protein AXF12_05855 [Capnocytophaga haemolytica]SFN68768.1 hypothetical protein SAMN05444369_101330 [Capnocytophaga haemolytica]SNV05138.1 Uncharacterised protein [Capnocytophaga haemolytica]